MFEVFHHPYHYDISEHGETGTMPEGWYYWHCQPGCLPDSDPIGPFLSEDEAREDAEFLDSFE